MKFKTVIINGFGGVGKDAFIRECGKYAFIKNMSSVRRVKEAAALLGWNGEKEEKDRAFLCELKDLCERYNDMPFRDMETEYHWCREHTPTEILFLHIREPAQIARAKEAFRAVTVFIHRPDVKKIVGNHADAEVCEYDYDYYVINDSTIEELSKKAHEFVKWLREREDAV